MTKILRKAIMRRYMLENKYFKMRSLENPVDYRKYKNYCSKLYKKDRANIIKT